MRPDPNSARRLPTAGDPYISPEELLEQFKQNPRKRTSAHDISWCLNIMLQGREKITQERIGDIFGISYTRVAYHLPDEQKLQIKSHNKKIKEYEKDQKEQDSLS
jgi:hypothetical protein